VASEPSYGATPVVGSSVLSASADNTYTAPTHAVTLLGGQSPRQVTDGATNSNTTVTSATASFNSGDIGRGISGTGIPVGAIITAFASATSVTISAPATATATGVTLTLGGGVGTIVPEVRWLGTGTTVAGVSPIFLFDGTTYDYFDSVLVTVVTPSTTVLPYFARNTYSNLWIPPGWKLVAASTVASQLINCVALGENL